MCRRTISRREISLKAGEKNFSTRFVQGWNQKTKLLPAQWVHGSDPPSSPLPARAVNPSSRARSPPARTLSPKPLHALQDPTHPEHSTSGRNRSGGAAGEGEGTEGGAGLRPLTIEDRRQRWLGRRAAEPLQPAK